MAKCLSFPEVSKIACKQDEFVSEYSYKIYNSINDISPLVLDEIGVANNFFFSIGYWQSYQAAFLDKITFRYIIISQQGVAVAFAPFQIITFSGSNVANAESDSSFFQVAKTWFTKKIVNLVSLRLLVSGNTFLTGELALFIKNDYVLNEKLADAYHRSIDSLLDTENLNGVLIKDFYLENTVHFKNLEAQGFLKFKVNPNMEMEIRSNWTSFEDYVKDLTSKYRVRLHKAIARGSSLIYKQLTVANTIEHTNDLQRMLNEVIANSDFKLFNPDIAYMQSLQQNFPNNFRITGIFRENELIGFYSTYLNSGQLVACFVGMNKNYLKEHDLYLNILYKLIEQAIFLNTSTLIFGRTAMEIKSSVGALPKDMFLYVKHACPIRNFLVHTAVKTLSKNPFWQLRIPFKQKSPAN